MDSTDNSKLSHPRKPYYWPGDSGKGGGLQARRVTRLTTPPVDGVTGVVKGTVDFPGTAGAWLLSFAAAQDTWFRLYASAADRDADFPRTVDTFPPTTPIIFDGLLTKTDLAGELERISWGAGPGCINPGQFGFCTDGDLSTWWATDYYLGTGHPSARDMAIGDTFAVDFGEPIEIGSVVMRNGTTALALPQSFSVETSNNGTFWTTVIPVVTPTSGTADQHIPFSTPITTQYMRFKVVSVVATPGPWAIAEFVAYPAGGDGLLLRLANGDEMGIPCFNWDDAARQTFYYTAQCDPIELFLLYFGGFGWKACILNSWALAPDGTLVVTPHPPGISEDCILTGELPPLSGVEYSDPGGLRPRYFNIGNELRAFGTGGIVRIGPLPADMTVAVGHMDITRSSAEDTLIASAGICYYVFSGGGGFNNKPRLLVGVERASSTTIHGKIQWVDASGTTTSLVTSSAIACALGASCSIDTFISDDGMGTVTCTLKVNGTIACTATVPSDLVALAPTHQAVGFYQDASDPPGSSLSWGGLGINDVAIAGGIGTATVDIGYVPDEVPGGTLAAP